MIGHLIKEIVGLAKTCKDDKKIKRIDELWLKAEGLLKEAEKELEISLPLLRNRKGNPDIAYLSVVRAKGILQELDDAT